MRAVSAHEPRPRMGSRGGRGAWGSSKSGIDKSTADQTSRRSVDDTTTDVGARQAGEPAIRGSQWRTRWLSRRSRRNGSRRCAQIVPLGEIARAWKPALDQVWAVLHAHPEVTHGHNLFLYHHPEVRSAPMAIDFGVQVTQPFEAVGASAASRRRRASSRRRCTSARTTARRTRTRRSTRGAPRTIGAIGGASWEIYGDPTPDPALTETTISYLLA